MRKQWEIFIAFFRIGMLGFGGGPASIPLMRKEAVEKYQWMDEDEFVDMLSISNTLPGPIATKLAGYIGYRVSGWIGMLNALIASVVPTVIMVIILLRTLSEIREFDWVKGMTAAVLAVVGMMMAVLTWSFVYKAGKGMGWVTSIVMLMAIFVILNYLHIHPGIVIGILLMIAFSLPVKEEEEKKRGEHS